MSVLVIGVDFGTTYSGVAYSFCAEGTEPDQVDVIKKWPSNERGNNERHKVPTKISYSRNPRGEEVISWGYKIPADAKVLTWFKLLLLIDDDMPEYVKNSPHVKGIKNMMSELGKDPVHVIADYLRELWKHTLYTIEKEKGEDLVEGARFLITMTVPAIWKDYARGKMRSAMKLAGILEKRLAGDTTLSFISEPEAAALATLPELSVRNDLQQGDSFIICDCGGGTVDIISYTVNEQTPLKVSECVEGDGDLCGGAILDQTFADHLMKHIGKHAFRRITQKEKKKMLHVEWETGIKSNFVGDTPKYMVEMPRSVAMPAVNFLKEEMCEIFDSVIPKIHKLVDSQMKLIKEKTKKPSRFLILVGGFGRCPYIYQTLRDRKDSVKGPTTILQADGDRPWSAICRGAVIAGATGQGLRDEDVHIQTRVARLSYGWIYTSSKFNPMIHDERDKFFDPRDGDHKARTQMEWGIKRGQDINDHEPATYSYCRKIDFKATGLQSFADALYTSPRAEPSRRLDESVRKFADYTIVTPVPAEELSVHSDKSGFHYYFPTEHRFSVSGASLSLSIVSLGRNIGGTDVGMSCS